MLARDKVQIDFLIMFIKVKVFVKSFNLNLIQLLKMSIMLANGNDAKQLFQATRISINFNYFWIRTIYT